LQKEVSHLGHDLEKERSQQAAKQTEVIQVIQIAF
jgi:hypothetical protein